MKCYGQWKSPGYTSPEADECEIFRSLKEAEDTFWRRFDDPFYPCVEKATPEDSGPTMIIWLGTPEPDDLFPCDCYPEFRIELGPRGGVIRYRC